MYAKQKLAVYLKKSVRSENMSVKYFCRCLLRLGGELVI
jgi:hypothetical protein